MALCKVLIVSNKPLLDSWVILQDVSLIVLDFLNSIASVLLDGRLMKEFGIPFSLF